HRQSSPQPIRLPCQVPVGPLDLGNARVHELCQVGNVNARREGSMCEGVSIGVQRDVSATARSAKSPEHPLQCLQRPGLAPFVSEQVPCATRNHLLHRGVQIEHDLL